MPFNDFSGFIFWFLDYGFDVIGVLVIIWLLIYFIPRRDALYLDQMKEGMEDGRETMKVLHREVVSSRVLMTEHMTEHNKTQTKLLSDCVTLMENLVGKIQEQDDHALVMTKHMTEHDKSQTMLLRDCLKIAKRMSKLARLKVNHTTPPVGEIPKRLNRVSKIDTAALIDNPNFRNRVGAPICACGNWQLLANQSRPICGHVLIALHCARLIPE